ncbi:MAG: hypothetical protein J6C00_11250 [Eubacterium sp.]|nr:hypothetical protein [Eubacterium sp.]
MLKNPFFLVGVGISICMVICGIYGIYDCVTDTGIFWPGIYGAIALMVVEPILFLLLGLDFLLWFLHKKIKESRK